MIFILRPHFLGPLGGLAVETYMYRFRVYLYVVWCFSGGGVGVPVRQSVCLDAVCVCPHHGLQYTLPSHNTIW